MGQRCPSGRFGSPLILWLVLLACPKRAGEGDSTWDTRTPEATSAVVATIVGPTIITYAGVTIPIPDGWSGDIVDNALVVHTVEGVVVSLQRQAPAAVDPAIPPERPDCELLFDDYGPYRWIPGLSVDHTTSCATPEADGWVIDQWFAPLDGGRLRIAATFAAGRVFEGRERVKPLLSALQPVAP